MDSTVGFEGGLRATTFLRKLINVAKFRQNLLISLLNQINNHQKLLWNQTRLPRRVTERTMAMKANVTLNSIRLVVSKCGLKR